MQNYDKDHYHENRSSELERRASKRENGEAHLQILYSGAMRHSTNESKIKLVNHFYYPAKLTKVHRDRDRINNNWRIQFGFLDAVEDAFTGRDQYTMGNEHLYFRLRGHNDTSRISFSSILELMKTSYYQMCHINGKEMFGCVRQ